METSVLNSDFKILYVEDGRRHIALKMKRKSSLTF